MYFWFFLAALMGVMMFDTWSEKAKDKEVTVQPSYEALAMNFLQFHRAALQAYQNTMAESAKEGGVQLLEDYHRDYSLALSTGLYPIAVVKYNDTKKKYEVTEGFVSDTFRTTFDTHKGSFTGYNPYFVNFTLPVLYKPQANTSSFLYCTVNDESASGHAGFRSEGCTDVGGIRYVMTVRPFPTRFKGSDQFLMLQALAKASDNSRQVGIAVNTGKTASNGDGTDYNQPEGAHIQIMSAGRASTTWPYIPDYLACYYPLFKKAIDGTEVTQKVSKASSNPTQDQYSYMVALTIVKGEVITTEFGKIIRKDNPLTTNTICGW